MKRKAKKLEIVVTPRPKRLMQLWWEPRIQEAYAGQLASLGTPERIHAIVVEAAERASDYAEKELFRLKRIRDKKRKT